MAAALLSPLIGWSDLSYPDKAADSADTSHVIGTNPGCSLWRTLQPGAAKFSSPFLTVLLCALLSPSLFALDPHFLFTQYRQNLWTADNGLPASSVYSVVQTKDGFLWIGTSDGLARFDGIEFERFTQTDSPALSDPSIFTLLAARDGSLWLGTNSNLVRYSHGRFESISAGTALSGTPIDALAEDADGTIWIGTDDQGLFAYRKGQIKHWSKEHGHKLQAVTSLLPAGPGKLWVGTARGLFQLAGAELVPYTGFPKAVANHAIAALMRDKDGSLWAGTDAGVVHVRTAGVDVYTERDGLPRNMITQIVRDKQGTLWVVCLRGGLAALRGNRFEAYGKEKNEWLSNPVCLFEDREENLWVGLRSGLLQLQDTAPQNFGVPEGLPNGYMSSVLEDRSGTIWAGSRGGGLYRYSGGKWAVFPVLAGLPAEYIYSLYQDRKGALWIGAGGNHVFRWRQGKVTAFIASDRAGNGVNGIAEDGDGVLWLSTIYGGLSFFDGRSFKTLHKSDGLVSNDLSFVKASRDGCVWAGGAGGLSRVCHGRIRTLTARDGLPEGTVTAFHEDAAGVMWLGTSDGLVRYKAGQFTHYQSPDGLPEFSVMSILEHDGSLWLGSTHGLLRISKEELNQRAIGKTGHIRLLTIDHGDGMRSAECSDPSSSSNMVSRDGRLWFATTKGLVALDPDRLRTHVLPPPVARIDPWRPGDRLNDRSPPPENIRLAFRFRTARFTNPGRVRYEYRLEGFDRDWQNAGGRRYAFYTNIPPGKYELKVRASDRDGVPGPVATAAFELPPHFYQTVQFKIALVLFVVGLALLLARLRFRSLELRNADLERKIAKRTAQYREAAEQARIASSAKSEFFAKVSHEIRTPMNAVIGGAQLLELTGLDSEQAELTTMIRTSGAALLTLINDLLDLSKVEAGKLELAPQPFSLRSSIQTVRAMLLPLAAKKKVRLSCRIDPATPNYLTGDITRIQQVLINLISNAIKFTDHGVVELEIHSDPVEPGPNAVASLHFAVTDTGVGLSTEKLGLLFQPFSQGDCHTQGRYGGTGLGLAICKQLVELMGGRISAEAKEQGGAIFRFFVKLPLCPDKASQPASPAAQTRPPSPSALNLRTNILLAEDNLVNQKVAARMLQKLGFAADIAANGQEVLEKLRQRQYDLVLMDIQMPGMDGLEASRRIRALNSARPTIIALSANVHRDAVNECLAAGMDGFLAKPITLEALQEALLKAVPSTKINQG